jgi:hypothetical protein
MLAGKRFSFEPQTDAAMKQVEHVTLKSPFLGWLLEQLRTTAWPVHAVAARQPSSVHELTDHLFGHYRIDGGRIHLSGCSFEDRPFLRLSYLNTGGISEHPQVVHCFGTSNGELLDDDLRRQLELDELIPLKDRKPHLDEEVLRRWTEITRRMHEHRVDGTRAAPVAATLVWCKRAEGKLTFSIGQKSVEHAFSDWARLIVDRRVLPPPYKCPITGQTSYHLAATDDGRITVAHAIATCAESGQRVLETELESCEETGRRVLARCLHICPVTGRKVLTSQFKPCSVCRQSVSPAALAANRCSACRDIAAMPKADPRLARILDAYPKLDRWRSWKMSETEAAYVLLGTATWKRLLVVLDKNTLDVLHLALGSRFSSNWTPATSVQQADWLA